MTEKIAVKRLTNSDLTFFLPHYRRNPAVRQKAINLNSDILVDTFYPGLALAIKEREGRLPINLHIFGPGAAGDLNLMRKIMKQESYKNFRLNGEYIENPPDQPERFDPLNDGDLGLMQFLGELFPHSINLFLISSTLFEDREIYTYLDNWLGEQKMATITPGELVHIFDILSVPEEHPIFLITLESDLEDIVQGGSQGIQRLSRRSASHAISREMLNRSKDSASQIGYLGETYINLWLQQQYRNGKISDYDWVSSRNAISPYDFTMIDNNGTRILIDGKSTSGHHSYPIHISFSELLVICDLGSRYDIYRLSEVSEDGAVISIAENVKSKLSSIREKINNLPVGVSIDSLSIDPSILDFSQHIKLPSLTELMDDEEI